MLYKYKQWFRILVPKENISVHKCESSIVSLPGPHATLKSSVACASHPETIDWPFYRSNIDKYFDDYYIFIFLYSVLGDRYFKNNRNINHPCINPEDNYPPFCSTNVSTGHNRCKTVLSIYETLWADYGWSCAQGFMACLVLNVKLCWFERQLLSLICAQSFPCEDLWICTSLTCLFDRKCHAFT